MSTSLLQCYFSSDVWSVLRYKIPTLVVKTGKCLLPVCHFRHSIPLSILPFFGWLTPRILRFRIRRWYLWVFGPKLQSTIGHPWIHKVVHRTLVVLVFGTCLCGFRRLYLALHRSCLLRLGLSTLLWLRRLFLLLPCPSLWLLLGPTGIVVWGLWIIFGLTLS